MTIAQDTRHLLEGQHAAIRRLVLEVETAAEAVLRGQSAPGLQQQVVALNKALQQHNREEQQLLKPMLADVQALGGRLVDHLDASHSEQHTALERAIQLAVTENHSPQEAAKLALAALRLLVDHMDDEERQLMKEGILEDGYVADGCCS